MHQQSRRSFETIARDADNSSDDRTAVYLAALRTLTPLIGQHRDAFDRQRRIPDTVFEALADAGLFRLWLPKGLGGPELSPLRFMTVIEAASALDGTVGWLIGNGAGMSRVGGYLPASVTSRWFSDPRTFMVSATGAVGTAVPVKGGYRVSGRWPFGSGAPHATHFMGLASVEGEDGRDQPPICCYLTRDQVRLHDTWHVSGLRGTASWDFEAEGVFVPADRTHLFLGHQPTQPGLLYRIPSLSIFPASISAVPLGIARGAIDTFANLASRKSRQGTGALLCEREIVQATVGRAIAAHRAARAFLAESMSELMAAMDAGDDQLVRARVEFRIACAHAAESALRIVDSLAAEAGTAAIFEASALERAVRDVHAAVKHVAMTPNTYIVAGRLGLGLDPGNARF
ncbi:Acyl-CoA dehydrogenase [Rhodospirillales bacterium URHD0017]|nr:Acyl-CoA dehydrogenase [Rhodospirillales bacterium URHD0017]